MAREEILAGPLEVWKAPRGEDFPDLGEDPTGDWELIGASGVENYTEDGVSVELPQDIEEFIGAGSTMALKAYRTEESIEITVNVADMRLEMWQAALNGNPITEDTGQRDISLYRGGDVEHFSLLLRGKSPYDGDEGDGQFQLPAAYMSGEPEIEHQKGEVQSLELTFRSVLPEGAEMDDFLLVYSDAEATGT